MIHFESESGQSSLSRECGSMPQRMLQLTIKEYNALKEYCGGIASVMPACNKFGGIQFLWNPISLLSIGQGIHIQSQ
jgi:hypothetical protein